MKTLVFIEDLFREINDEKELNKEFVCYNKCKGKKISLRKLWKLCSDNFTGHEDITSFIGLFGNVVDDATGGANESDGNKTDDSGDIVGVKLGEFDGDFDGVLLGDFDGELLGVSVGDIVGVKLGEFDGDWLGESLGESLGDFVGDFVGEFDGDLLGVNDGNIVGVKLGDSDGGLDGLFVGANVGFVVGGRVLAPFVESKTLPPTCIGLVLPLLRFIPT